MVTRRPVPADRHRCGWDDLDQQVLGLFRVASTRTQNELTRQLPGVPPTQVTESLNVLVDLGYLTTVPHSSAWKLTPAGRERLADDTASCPAA